MFGCLIADSVVHRRGHALGKRCNQPLIGDGFPKLEMYFALKFIISIIMSDGYLKLFIC